MNYVTVIHTAGQFSTPINCDEAEARDYYVGHWFNVGEGEHDKMVKVLDIRFQAGTTETPKLIDYAVLVNTFRELIQCNYPLAAGWRRLEDTLSDSNIRQILVDQRAETREQAMTIARKMAATGSIE